MFAWSFCLTRWFQVLNFSTIIIAPLLLIDYNFLILEVYA